ncbi:hypothetical protein J6590_001297 [Homalodisca vitripennis]|nr:hypothetical protein J6590_001297 [Homalodisca vitripennis]
MKVGPASQQLCRVGFEPQWRPGLERFCDVIERFVSQSRLLELTSFPDLTFTT